MSSLFHSHLRFANSTHARAQQHRAMDASQSSSWWSRHERPQSRSGDAWSRDERPQSRSRDNAVWQQRSWWDSGEHGAAKRTWWNDNDPQTLYESAPSGTDWSTERAWEARAPHTETAEPKIYQISTPREGTRQWTSESTAAVSDPTGYRGSDIRYTGYQMLPPHCKSGTVIDLAAGSAVADQQAPSPVADQVVGSAVAEDKAPSPVAGQAVGPAVADHKAPSPVADQAVGSAVVGQNVPPPEAAAGCKAAAPLTIINNKKPPPSVPPPHTTAQAQIRVQPPGHESKEKKPPPPLPKRLITTNDTPVWASVQTTTPKMTFRAPSVNRVCETPFAFFVPGRGIVMESRCKKQGSPWQQQRQQNWRQREMPAVAGTTMHNRPQATSGLQ